MRVQRSDILDAVLCKVKSTEPVVKEVSIEGFCSCIAMIVRTSVVYEDLDYFIAWQRGALIFCLWPPSALSTAFSTWGLSRTLISLSYLMRYGEI